MADAGDSVDVLLADYAMPGMSGADLARTVGANWPELPVVVVTGYADTTGLGDQLDDTVLLHKPFGVNELASAIDRAVQRNGAAANDAKVVPLRPRATG